MSYIDSYKKLVRIVLKDFIKNNRLTEDEYGDIMEENTDEEIEAAIFFVKNECEVSPPLQIDNFSLEEWTKHMFFTWGVMAFLLDANSIVTFRNIMPMADGTVTIDDSFKAGPYSTMALNLWTRFREDLQLFKVHYNLMNFQWEGTSHGNFWVYNRGGWTSW